MLKRNIATRIQRLGGVATWLFAGLIVSPITQLYRRTEYSDVIVVLGMVSMGVGLWWFRPWVSLTVIGLLLIGLGIKRG